MTLLAARRAFGDLPVVHVATTFSDGTPHVVPLWFVWPGEAIYVSCDQGSATWRNVERDRRAALSFGLGRDWDDLRGVALHGRAQPYAPNHPSLRGVVSAWHEKYRSRLGGDGFAAYAALVEEPGLIRFRTERFAAWDHRRAAPGETAGNPGG